MKKNFPAGGKRVFRGFLNLSVVSAYQVNQVARYVQNIVMSILIVKSGLGMSDVGLFEIWFFSIAMLCQFWIAGFKDALVSGYNHRASDVQNKWLYTGVFSHLTAGLFFAAVFWVLYPLILQGSQISGTFDLRYAGMIFLVFHALSQLPENIMLIRNQGKWLLVYTYISAFLHLLLFIFYYFSFPVLSFLIAGLLVIAILKSAVLLFLVKNEPFSGFTEFRSFLRFAFPFILISVLGYGMEMVDGVLVMHFFDESVFPVYKYGAREIPLSSLLMNSLSVALIPMMVDKENVTALYSHVKKYMHILFPFSIGIVWVSQPAYIYFYNESYSESAFIFNLYLLVIGSRLLLPHTILLARGQQKWVLISSAFELGMNILLSVWWVHWWGMYGLVLATVVAFYLQKVIMLLAMKKYMQVTLSDIIPVRWWVIYQIVLIISVYGNYLWYHA